MTETNPDGSQTPPPKEISDFLANQRRRYPLYYQTACEYAVPLDELAQQVAVWETETNATEISDDVSECVHSELVHVHLPKLVDSGIVKYDTSSQLIALSENTGRLDEYLRRAAKQENQET